MARWAALAALLFVLLSPTVGRADVSPPDLSDCEGKMPAADCMTDDRVRGRCAEITWSYINYGPHGPDGSRRVKELVCKPTPPLLEGVPVWPLLGGFCFSLLVVGSGLFMVVRRRRRLAS